MTFDIENLRIGVGGLGYVGLPLAVEFGKRYPTVGFDVKPERIAELEDGHDSTLEVSAEELAEANIGLASDIISCPGLDYCALATARSIPVAQRLSEELREREQREDLRGITVNISGCINACGHHHAATIGILGLNRAEQENYQITLAGRADEGAQVGTILGPGFDAEALPGAVHRILDTFQSLRRDDENLADVYARVGKEPFKQAAYPALENAA